MAYQYEPTKFYFSGNTEAGQDLRGYGESQMVILKTDLSRRELKIGSRKLVDKQTGVEITCDVCHTIARVTIHVPEIIAPEKPEEAKPAEHVEGELVEKTIFKVVKRTSFSFPMSDTSWGIVAKCFLAGSYEGRFLVLTGKTIFLQDGVNSSNWTLMGRVENTSDAAFIAISPSGNRIAFGLGWSQNILIINTSELSTSAPIFNADSWPIGQQLEFDANHYDAIWLDETWLVINGGMWASGPAQATSAIARLNTSNRNNLSEGTIAWMDGGSSSLCVNSFNSLYTGVGGNGQGTIRNGEIRKFLSSTWISGGAPVTPFISYNNDADEIIHSRILSAATLCCDGNDHLYVGGGEFLRENDVYADNDPAAPLKADGTHETWLTGYAVVIGLGNILDYEPSVPSDAVEVVTHTIPEGDRAILQMVPDACKNDTGTWVYQTPDGVVVAWNPKGYRCGTKNYDWWHDGDNTTGTNYKILGYKTTS